MPTLSGAVFKIVEQSGITTPGGVVAIGGADTGLGGRGSGKINVIWTQNFSSYLEAHGAWVNGIKHVGFVGSQSYGMMGGLRYTWQ